MDPVKPGSAQHMARLRQELLQRLGSYSLSEVSNTDAYVQLPSALRSETLKRAYDQLADGILNSWGRKDVTSIDAMINAHLNVTQPGAQKAAVVADITQRIQEPAQSHGVAR